MNAWWTTLWQADQVEARWLVIVAITLVAAVTDWRSRTIPNWLTGPAVLAGLLAAAFFVGWAGLVDALMGMALCLAPFLFLFVFAGGGAGDAKLMAAVGAWVGVIGSVVALLSVLLAGAVLSLAWIVWQGRVAAVWANLLWILMSLRTATLGKGDQRRDYILPAAETLHAMPYGLAIFVGCVVAAGVVLL